MESFISLEGWRPAALLLNLIAFFFAFSAFSVGILISARVRRVLGQGRLAGVVNCFLIAAAGLALRCLVIMLFHLGVLPAMVAVAVSDLLLVVVGGALLGAYLVFERFLKTKETP